MTIDIKALSKPIGFLPETSYGVPIQGCNTSGLVGIGVSNITLNPATPYDADMIVGMKVQILGDSYVITAYNPGTGVTGIAPATLQSIPNATPVLFEFIPFSHKIDTFEPNEDYNRDTWGEVSGGIVDHHASQAGRSSNLSWEGIKGCDLFKWYPAVHRMSSLLAYAYSSDGKVASGTGVVTFRATSGAQSITVLWATKTGENRLSYGTLIASINEDWPEDMDALDKISGEFTSQRISDDITDALLLTYKWALPSAMYGGPLMKAHGSTDIRVRHKTFLKADATLGTDLLLVHCPWGFAIGDSLNIYHADGVSFDTLDIANIDYDTGLVTLSGAITRSLARNKAFIVHNLVSLTAYKTYRFKSLSLKTTTGQVVQGDVSKPFDYPTVPMANGFMMEGDAAFYRESMVLRRMSKRDSQFTRIILDIIEYEDYTQVGVQVTIGRRLEFALTGPVAEKLTGERDALLDELTIKLCKEPFLALNYGFPT